MLDTVRPYITKDEPFGPIDSMDIASADVRALKLLFEQHNWIYKNLRNRPSIIIGRRGSGKTSYLRSVFFEKEYDYHTEIGTARVLGNMARVIQRMSADAVFPEMVSELWETVLWISVFSEIRKLKVLPWEGQLQVETYLEQVSIRKDQNDSEDVLSTLATMIDKVLEKNPLSVASEILRGPNRKIFEDARSSVLKYLESSGKKFVILMDSLDNFQLNMESVANSLQGLLKLVGSMNKPRDVVDIRFCMPSELYHSFMKISSNPNKDFRRALKLQWSASELVLIGAQRLTLFLALYYEDFIRKLFPLDVGKRSDALALFRAVLPEKITNRAGYQEETMSYILRHTQLLPRHFIMVLNSIFRSARNTKRLMPFPLSEDRIINGVRLVEEYMINEIFVAFKLNYPNAEETCKRCLPELAHKFTMSDLHRVFVRHGKAVFGSDDLHEFQRMLLEIGAIGRVIPGKESDFYIKGNFEYTVAHQINLSQDDEMCIHPLFSGIYHVSGRDTTREERPVYPYGSELEDKDYRYNEE